MRYTIILSNINAKNSYAKIKSASFQKEKKLVAFYIPARKYPFLQ